MLDKISLFFTELAEDFQNTPEQQKNTELSLEISCADLLHLRHNEYIATKIAAKEFHITIEKK